MMTCKYAIISCLSIMAIILFGACTDDSLQDEAFVDSTDNIPSDAIRLDGSEQTYDLTRDANGKSIKSITIDKGDFASPLTHNEVYLEQNDDEGWRVATITANFSDGSKRTYHLAQAAISRAETVNNFVRHHGVGYSYDGVNGGYCDLTSIRCQVLNRAVIQALYDDNDDIDDNLYREEENSITDHTYNKYTSIEDYVQRNHFSASINAKLIVFKGDAQAAINAFEQGTLETYIYQENVNVPKVNYRIEVGNIRSYVDKYPNLLTSSFRKAIKNLNATKDNDTYAVEEFVNTYGTHIVNSTTLGAKLSIEVQVEAKKFNSLIGKNLNYDVSFSKLWNRQYSSEEIIRIDSVFKDCKCRVDALGGDLSMLNGIINMTEFDDGTVSDLGNVVNKWEESVIYDTKNLAESNVELTDMEIIPIWELIADSKTSDRVRAYIEGNAELMQQLLGNRNFVNTSFCINPQNVTCKIGGVKQTFNNPDVVDMICAHRHVATICKEIVPELDKKEKVWVAYPIYEGYVKLDKGLCIYGDSAYRVSWYADKFTVKGIGKAPMDGTVYMNLGEIEPTKASNLTYQTAYPILGCERPGGIDINGNIAGSMVTVKKHFGQFYLGDTKRYDNLPNWSYVNSLPSEQTNYSSYIGNEWCNRMVRNDDYTYIYNPKEVSYE